MGLVRQSTHQINCEVCYSLYSNLRRDFDLTINSDSLRWRKTTLLIFKFQGAHIFSHPHRILDLLFVTAQAEQQSYVIRFRAPLDNNNYLMPLTESLNSILATILAHCSLKITIHDAVRPKWCFWAKYMPFVGKKLKRKNVQRRREWASILR